MRSAASKAARNGSSWPFSQANAQFSGAEGSSATEPSHAKTQPSMRRDERGSMQTASASSHQPPYVWTSSSRARSVRRTKCFAAAGGQRLHVKFSCRSPPPRRETRLTPRRRTRSSRSRGSVSRRRRRCAACDRVARRRRPPSAPRRRSCGNGAAPSSRHRCAVARRASAVGPWLPSCGGLGTAAHE